MQYEVVISPQYRVQIYTGMSMTALCLRSLNTWNGGGWTDRKYVCTAACLNSKLFFVFDAVWGRNLAPMCCPNIHYNGDAGFVFMFVEYLGRTASCWRWTDRKYVCIAACCLNLKLFFMFDTVWGRNITLMCCPNTLLQWRWRLCVYVRWMPGTVSCWLWTNRKYVCIGVCLHLKLLVIRVRCSMRS